MAITQDGNQFYGITSVTVTATSGFIVESFSTNETGERVDINDGNGEPLGSVTVPGRTEFSMTAQFGTATNAAPVVGQTLTYAGLTLIVQDVSVAETQADYKKLDISGYKKIN